MAPKIQIDGSRTRAAVQREGDRPVLALHGVRGADHFARLLAAVENRHRAHRDRVMERLSIQLHGLRDMRFRRQRSFLLGRLIFVLRVGGRGWSGRLAFLGAGTESAQAQNKNSQSEEVL